MGDAAEQLIALFQRQSDDIEWLRAENRHMHIAQGQRNREQRDRIAELEAEVERLQADAVDKARAWDAVTAKSAEIARLRSIMDEMGEALEPFAKRATAREERDRSDGRYGASDAANERCRMGDLRRARAALTKYREACRAQG